MSRHKQYRAPWVLEIAAPTGSGHETQEALDRFNERERIRKDEERLATVLDSTMDHNWNNPTFWTDAGVARPAMTLPESKKHVRDARLDSRSQKTRRSPKMR